MRMCLILQQNGGLKRGIQGNTMKEGGIMKLGPGLFFNLGLKIRKNRKNKPGPNSHAPFFHFSNGQSMTEYAILIAIVSAVIVAMQIYMRMSIQGVIKVAADEIGKQEDSWEDAHLDNAVKTNSVEINGGPPSTTRVRTMQGGSYRTDVNETNYGVGYGYSESEEGKY